MNHYAHFIRKTAKDLAKEFKGEEAKILTAIFMAMTGHRKDGYLSREWVEYMMAAMLSDDLKKMLGACEDIIENFREDLEPKKEGASPV